MNTAKGKSKFSITHNDQQMIELVGKTDQKTLAVWAIDCAKRVLPYFEDKYPKDLRPRQAIVTLKRWIDTGEFKMAVIRKSALDAHSAARFTKAKARRTREAEENNAACSAARACGQAVATAHVPRHSYGCAIYAQQAIHRATDPSHADAATARERDWQYQRLLKLREHA